MSDELNGESGRSPRFDPTEPLLDLTVVNGVLCAKPERLELGCPCGSTGWIGREWLEVRDPECTCGSGDPNDWLAWHHVSCDAVPCPFCPLENRNGA